MSLVEQKSYDEEINRKQQKNEKQKQKTGMSRELMHSKEKKRKCFIDKAWNKLMIIAQRSIKCFTFNQNCSFIYSLNIKQSYCIQLQLQFQSWPLSTLSIMNTFIHFAQGRQGWNINLFLVFFLSHNSFLIIFLFHSFTYLLASLTHSLHFNPMDDYCQYITKKNKIKATR